MKRPIPPVRGAHVVNSFVGFSIEPTVTSQTTTRKSDNVLPGAVDNREFEIAIERRGIYQFPFHGDHKSPTSQPTSVI